MRGWWIGIRTSKLLSITPLQKEIKMQAVEFKTKIQDGCIFVPERYRNKISANVKVILLTEQAMDDDLDFINEIINNPIKMKDFTPLKRDFIYER